MRSRTAVVQEIFTLLPLVALTEVRVKNGVDGAQTRSYTLREDIVA